MLSAVVLSGVYAAPPETVTQGYYEGVLVYAGGSKSMVARVVTLGKGEYKVFIQSNSGRNEAQCVELLGKVEGDAVVFKGSFDYHVEFLIPLRAESRGQGRGNSGVFFPCGTEIQVLDSFGMPTYTGGCCGGLYKWINPNAMQDIPSLKDKKSENKFNLASLPPLEWQTYDIEYRVKVGKNGKKESYLTAYQNGIKIHDNVKLRRPFREGNLQYQDHGNPVHYRNIWFVPVD